MCTCSVHTHLAFDVPLGGTAKRTTRRALHLIGCSRIPRFRDYFVANQQLKNEAVLRPLKGWTGLRFRETTYVSKEIITDFRCSCISNISRTKKAKFIFFHSRSFFNSSQSRPLASVISSPEVLYNTLGATSIELPLSTRLLLVKLKCLG